jgi:hypothetical protein
LHSSLEQEAKVGQQERLHVSTVQVYSGEHVEFQLGRTTVHL